MTTTKGAISTLTQFMPAAQLGVVRSRLAGEERDFFRAKLIEYAERVTAMPKTYQQDGLGVDAVVHLHYFTGGCDWWITERDMEDEQHQAFGYVNLGDDDNAGWGYVSLVELCAVASVELDLYWTPKPMREIKTTLA